MTAPTDISRPALEIDPEAFRALGYRAVDLAVEHLRTIREQAVFTPMPPASRSALMDQPLPMAGRQPAEILSAFAETILPFPMGNGHPRFFGWVNSPPAPIGMLGDFLASVMGPSCAGGDHAAIYLERCANRWLMELVGFPVNGSMGLLVSGGSMASLTCLAAARQRLAQNEGFDLRAHGLQDWSPSLTLYLSTETHTTLRKAIELLGIGTDAIRVIPVTTAYQIDLAALRSAISADRAAGLRPFCVVASAGTVATGAIDPFEPLADICAEEGLWLHVDGAYGAFGILDPAAAPAYAGLDRVDSLALDPHKWLSVPVECGCALVRDGQLLRDTFSLVPPYIRTEEGKGFGGLPWFSEYGFQQTRGFRALKLWMTLMHAGRDGLAAMVSRQNELARALADQIAEAPDLECLAPVSLSIVCFRFRPSGMDASDERLNALNKAIMEQVQAGGEAFVTQADLQGRFALRANILHYATNESDLAALVDVIRRTGREIATQMALG